MTLTISINSSTDVSMDDDHNYDGFVKVINGTDSDIDGVEVTPENDSNGSSFGFAYKASTLAPYVEGELATALFVPVDSSYPDLHIAFTIAGSQYPSTQSVKAYAGAPRIKGTSPGIDTWQYARCSGTLTVRNNASNNDDVWAQLDGVDTIYPVPSGRSTGIHGVTTSDGPLWVSLNADMSSPTSITVVHQDGTTVTVSDPEDGATDFSVDTQVISANTNGQSDNLTVTYDGAQAIEITTVTFDLSETVIGTIDSTNASLTFRVDDTIAYLRIGSPPNDDTDTDTDTDAVAPSPPTTTELDDDGLPQFIPLGGDPVVLVKHTGYATGGKSR